MMRVRIILFVFMVASIVASMVASLGAAQDTTTSLDQAIAGYGDALDTEDRDLRIEGFRRVERLFGSAVEGGYATADLYANLGNAALQAEHLGSAVLAYRRALVLDPDHNRARQNHIHVRDQVPDWVPRPDRATAFDSFFQWHANVSETERAWAAALAFLIAAALLSLGVVVRSVAARNTAVLPGLVWCGLLVSTALDPTAAAKNDAVVVSREVVARSADSVHAPARFARPLPMGTEVEILEDRDGWLRIELANGREAWVRSSSVKRVIDG